MKYMGSKARISKYILPIMLKGRTDETQYWVEPFVGGANMLTAVTGNRIGADNNPYLIAALTLIRDAPETIPDLITESDYDKLRQAMAVDGITGFTGFAMSYGGKFFGGYRRDVAGTKGCIQNMQTQTRRSKGSAIKQSPKLQGVQLICTDYQNLTIPPNSIIYCDPPYANTTKYKTTFDHTAFWQWCRVKARQGYTVYISEYQAPTDFECVWSKTIASSLTKATGSKQGVEKLFVYRG